MTEARRVDWAGRLAARRDGLRRPVPVVEGRLRRMIGLTLEAEGCEAPVGSRCEIFGHGDHSVEAEVVGFAEGRLFLMPTGALHGVTPNARVLPREEALAAHVGPDLLGRVLDGGGEPLDDRPAPEAPARMPLAGRSINPLGRAPIREPLDVGIRAINALLTVGQGQRMGLFAGSGVGKSVLLGMMTRYTNADVVVVGLIGERGREVKEFIEDILGEEGLARSAVVAAPADTSPLMRMHGAMLAASIAEYFRDQGLRVLLLMDSLTRYAQAQREIGLAIGEPPATKGYPPSVFARLPQLVERAGNAGRGEGSITAFYTVLTEGDDQQDPVADSARAILDGHIVLSRSLAESGHYPAIDIEASASRAMLNITDDAHVRASQRLRRLYATYRRNEDLINVGAYQHGSDASVDEAIAYHSSIMRFLGQDIGEAVSFRDAVAELHDLIGEDTGASLA
ncbi:Flagellum-specific ATP synthase [wastewater metagenome]|uniref:Flagellum-specific ATP synthase n=3 Tax=root TaxID=1 RepID=A0A5B8R784_9ZZZZ|nr:flagellum-specific ATP synthase [uncultured organism]